MGRVMGIRAFAVAAAVMGMTVANGHAFAEGDPAAGEKAFRVCKACHATEAGKNRVGPSLFGVVGAKAGHVDTFKYSDALKASGITWDDEHLDKWLTGPRDMVEGTKMVFAGFDEAQTRADVIAYLKTLK